MADELFKNRFGMTANVLPQHEFVVTMHALDGDVKIRIKAASIEKVIDAVKGRRISTPPGMSGFYVDEV